MAKDTDKKPIFKHEHPLYQWLALLLSVFLVLGLAGWYYLSYLDTLNAQTDSIISSSYTTTVKNETNADNPTEASNSVDQAEVDKALSSAEVQVNGANNNDFSDSTLGSSAVGVK